MLLISYVRGLLIGVPHRVRLNVADDKVFEAYRELLMLLGESERPTHVAFWH